jgi:LacI family transcriptional regulator
MRDIAVAAGVGKATVSLALRNDPRLRLATRRRIQALARKMGYRPNATVATLMAQLRASRAPRYQATIALVNAGANREYLHTVPTFRSWMDGIERRAAQLGYGLDHFWLYEPGISPERLAGILDSRSIQGVILAAVQGSAGLDAKFDVVWERSSSVMVGVRPTHPPLHFCCNDQYSTSLGAILQLTAMGYQRPALVISPEIDDLVDNRFSGGFLVGQSRLRTSALVPVFPHNDRAEPAFRAWFQNYRPDVILTLHTPVRDWIKRMDLRVPQDIGLVHLDLTSDMTDWAGMVQSNELVGVAATDMVVAQLHRNEVGVPAFTKCMLIESTWMPGPSVRLMTRRRRSASASR